jgi:hypothetical protein
MTVAVSLSARTLEVKPTQRRAPHPTIAYALAVLANRGILAGLLWQAI